MCMFVTVTLKLLNRLAEFGMVIEYTGYITFGPGKIETHGIREKPILTRAESGETNSCSLKYFVLINTERCC